MKYRSVLVVHKSRKSLERLSSTLKNVGHKVTVVPSAKEAFRFLDEEYPDMIIASDDLEDLSVFELCTEIKDGSKCGLYPAVMSFIIVAQENNEKGKELAKKCAADEYVTEPFALPSLMDRINLILSGEQHTDLSGSIAKSGLIDVLQMIEFTTKSGILTVTQGTREGTVRFSEGQLLDARLDDKRNEAAVYDMLSWKDGEFSFQMQEITNGKGGLTSISSLVLEWARANDEGSEVPTQAPPAYEEEAEKEKLETQEEEEEREVVLDPHNWASSLNAWLGYLRGK